MPKTLSYTVAKRPTAWSFVSGKIAALEASLQPRGFFEAVLKAPNRAEARAALGKSEYRVLFPDDGSLDKVSSILEQKAKEVRGEMFSLCPPHPLENFFGIASRFRTFRTLFNQRSTQGNPQAGEMDALFPAFAVEEAYAKGLREHRDFLQRKSAPQLAAPLERSLYLDSAACSLMRVVAGFVPEKTVRDYMTDVSLLKAWSGLFRLRWNGVPAEVCRNWFIYDNSTELATALLAQEQDPKAVISGRLTSVSSAALEALDPNRIKADIDSAAADVLRETVLTARRTPFGAERVMSYLVAQEAEMVNLELSLSAVANGIDRDVTLSRLRREYA